MKFKILIIVCLLFVSNTNAQDIDLTELKAPSSPAFTILGVQPTEIARPTTFDAFKASLIDNFSDDNGIALPQNLALEFTPFWLFSHKNLTFENVLKSKNVGDNILRNSSFSVATVDIKDVADSAKIGTRMGIGYRTMIFKGSPSKVNKNKILTAVDEMKAIQGVALGVINPLQQLARNPSIKNLNDFIEQVPQEMTSYYNSQKISQDNKDQVKVLINDVIMSWLEQQDASQIDTNEKVRELINKDLFDTILAKDSDISKLIKTLSEKAKVVDSLLDTTRTPYKGFFLEFAASLALDFNDDTFNNSKVSKWGVWLTPSYRLENDTFEFLGVVRYIKNEALANMTSDNFDIGGKIVFQKERFSCSGEFIQRFQDAEAMDNSNMTSSKNDLKAVLNLEYKLTNNILITYTFGEDFNVNTETNSNVISTIGLSYNIGGNTKSIKLFD